MKIEKGAALSPAASVADEIAPALERARRERALVFGLIVKRMGDALAKMLLGADHSLVNLVPAERPRDIPFHSRQALGLHEAIPSKADRDELFGSAAPVLPFEALRAGLNIAETSEKKAAA